MVKGVIEVNSFGQNIKQYEVAIDLNHFKSMVMTIMDVYSLEKTMKIQEGHISSKIMR